MNGRCGIGFLPALFLVFLVLKLCDVIDWSWWYVAAPLYVPLAIGVVFYLAVVFFGLLWLVWLALDNGMSKK